jgi:hypothetical protein
MPPQEFSHGISGMLFCLYLLRYVTTYESGGEDGLQVAVFD